MHPKFRFYLYDEHDNKFFGEGPCKLLHAIEDTGSLNKAAASMHMAYTKALAMMKHAQDALGFPLTTTTIGGKGGGGSSLTNEAKEFLTKYETYQKACTEANERIYHTIFSEQL